MECDPPGDAIILGAKGEFSGAACTSGDVSATGTVIGDVPRGESVFSNDEESWVGEFISCTNNHNGPIATPVLASASGISSANGINSSAHSSSASFSFELHSKRRHQKTYLLIIQGTSKLRNDCHKILLNGGEHPFIISNHLVSKCEQQPLEEEEKDNRLDILVIS